VVCAIDEARSAIDGWSWAAHMMSIVPGSARPSSPNVRKISSQTALWDSSKRSCRVCTRKFCASLWRLAPSAEPFAASGVMWYRATPAVAARSRTSSRMANRIG
jgi:hypothetical protein